MAYKLCGYDFVGPLFSIDHLRNVSGIYVIIDNPFFGTSKVLDVGESGDIRSRIATHDRAPCWRRNASGSIGVLVLATPGWADRQRRDLEARIRDQYRPCCGDR